MTIAIAHFEKAASSQAPVGRPGRKGGKTHQSHNAKQTAQYQSHKTKRTAHDRGVTPGDGTALEEQI